MFNLLEISARAKSGPSAETLAAVDKILAGEGFSVAYFLPAEVLMALEASGAVRVFLAESSAFASFGDLWPLSEVSVSLEVRAAACRAREAFVSSGVRAGFRA